MLLGPSYASRLWCIVELFTFLKMGGEREAILTFELGDDPETRLALGKFDAAKAKCFLNKDRERLLAVIEAGYGDLGSFSKIVQGIFAKPNLRAADSADAVRV